MQEAALRLGMTEDGVRKRIRRNQIKYEQDEDGRYFVYLDPSDTTEDKSGRQSRDELVEALEKRIESLERQLNESNEANRENRRIIAALTQRIPELEPARESAPESRESSVTTSKEEGKGQVRPESEKTEPQPWWRRLFSG